MNLSIQIGNLKLKNPVTVASGTFGHAEEYYDSEEVKKLGAIVPKTVTLHAREGNPPPRIIETASGMINAIGIENPGADVFIKEKLPFLRKIGVPVIVSILGHTDEEFTALIRKFNATHGVSALELNLSCPNLKNKTLVAQDPEATFRIMKMAKTVSNVPVIAKLSPNVTDITSIALAAESAGADAVSLVNTFVAMAIDIKTRTSILGNITGGLSGPAIKPIALSMVYQTAKKIRIPIIAMGGIATTKDALEFLIAGASVVAVGTFNFVNPRAPLEILNGIKEYMREHKVKNIKEIIGSIGHKHETR
ncbi:MAG TPA: dihydroorotate dehydrogenase [Candidatus Omnitrophota bacterium]|nr:dihydroorotate dehydrogenase [Candidatus Omnitrophota bacterium]HPD84491.1 dihydroorotate dehydrogenase [Candidatus Omnitrophota bacterium]HRZ03349.1 dihydroorotate dehydrogenase [Candidatus Omnitrophota bacterium]